MKIRKDVRLVEPEVLQRIGKESKAKGTQKRTSKQIDTMSKAARASRTKSS